MLIGVIADDFTGATDIAGFLVSAGVSTTQVIGVPPDTMRPEAEAVVISLKSRSCPPAEAIADSLAALAWLTRHGCTRIYQKYCSTFDSTKDGNIGPVADALLDALGTDFTVVCPALPINGRTIYNGYLFVNGVLLSESGMRHHPVTPMTDPSLVRLMAAQSRGTCGVITADVVDQGVDAVRAALLRAQAEGHRYAVLDALTDAHLDVLGAAVADMPLVTGGSGLAAGMAKSWSDRLVDPVRAAEAGKPLGTAAVVLAGSCSTMTNAQVAAYRAEAPARAIDVARCLADPEGYAETLAGWVLENRGKRWGPLVYATTDPAGLKAVQQTFGAAASTAIEKTLAALAARLASAGFDRFIVAGGETSGAVVQALGVTAFHIGPTIAPGVPWVRAVDRPVSMALKSGNFGQARFFFDCQEQDA
ncbi:putative pyridoxine biosynthesis protein [Rhodovulum sp. PH10]|uniref:3-oxo-tetronate kinase n=1 Tax=Rhodovulum sp. PH10 TaxID=1187851 RepID=UPI00027C2DE0|nr:3-oxo-tetronate kinase [Rhodovulum sp. PH10]EJW09933.1 putative pyridoxine biosynthesis protein [Rhodovulum sp. PH10]